MSDLHKDYYDIAKKPKIALKSWFSIASLGIIGIVLAFVYLSSKNLLWNWGSRAAAIPVRQLILSPLQQSGKTTIPSISGTGTPGGKITIKIPSKSMTGSTIVNAKGVWTSKLFAIGGGTNTIIVKEEFSTYSQQVESLLKTTCPAKSKICTWSIEGKKSTGYAGANTTTATASTTQQPTITITNDGICTVKSGQTISLTDTICGTNRKDKPDIISVAVSSIGTNSITASESAGMAAGDEVILINLQGTAKEFQATGTYEMFRIKEVKDNTITFSSDIQWAYGNANKNSDLTGQKIVLQRVPNYKEIVIESGGILTASAWNGTKGGMLAVRSDGAVTVKGSISMTQKGYRSSTSYFTSAESYCGFNAGKVDLDPKGALPGYVLGHGSAGICGGGGGGIGGGEEDLGYDVEKTFKENNLGKYFANGDDSAEDAYNEDLYTEYMKAWANFKYIIGRPGPGGLGGAGGSAGGGGGGGGYGTGGGGGYAMGYRVVNKPTMGEPGRDTYSGSGGYTIHKSQGAGGGGGGTYGDSAIRQVFLGSGGGAGGCSKNANTPAGGIIMIFGAAINVKDGTIEANGGPKEIPTDSCAGASSGGSILLVGTDVQMGTNKIQVNGGKAGKAPANKIFADSLGHGGLGRIAIYFSDMVEGATTPWAYMYKIE